MNETYLIKNHIVNINSTNHLKIKSNVKDLKTYIDKISILGGKVIQLDKKYNSSRTKGYNNNSF